MPKPIHYENGTLTASGGTASIEFVGNNTNKLDNILIKATTGSTTFNVSITDHLGNVTNQWFNITGELNENNIGELMIGNHTVTISNSSVLDEVFNYLLKYDES